MTPNEIYRESVAAKGREHLNGMRAYQRTALVIAVYLATEQPGDIFADDVPKIIEALNNGLVNAFPKEFEIEYAIGLYIAAHPKASYEEICAHFIALWR